jgi:hypothetical protein
MILSRTVPKEVQTLILILSRYIDNMHQYESGLLQNSLAKCPLSVKLHREQYRHVNYLDARVHFYDT